MAVLALGQTSPSERIHRTDNHESQKQEPDGSSKTEIGPSAAPTSGLAQPAVQTQPKEKSNNRDCLQRIADYLKKAFSPEFLSDWFLVLTGMLGVGFAWRTLDTLIEQTRATKIAADAGKASADALIRGDRAWLLIDDVKPPFIVPVNNQSDPTRPRASHCLYYFKNVGKTPAKLTAWKNDLYIGNSADDPPASATSSYDLGSVVFNPGMIPQGGEKQISPEDARLDTGFITPQELTEINTQNKFLWLCGILTYEDVFDERVRHETRFCYLYETRIGAAPPPWRLAGPSEYNTAT
jgi:hypothetical protein